MPDGRDKRANENDDLDVRPDAWERFKRAVHVMAKAGPQHRIGGVAVKSGQHKLASDSAHQKKKRPAGQPKA